MIVWISAFSIATSRLGVKRKVAVACRTRVWPRGSITKILAPRFAACLKKVAATGWFSVGRAPMRMMTSASAAAVNGADTAPEPMPSIKAATDDAIVVDLVGQLTADAAIGADAVDLAIRGVGIDAVRVDQGRRHQRSGRTGLHAFAAGDAGAVAHGVVKIEHDLFVVAARRHADHVVDLHLAAGPDAKIALDAGVELDRHRRMAAVGSRRRVPWEAAVLAAQPV